MQCSWREFPPHQRLFSRSGHHSGPRTAFNAGFVFCWLDCLRNIKFYIFLIFFFMLCFLMIEMYIYMECFESLTRCQNPCCWDFYFSSSATCLYLGFGKYITQSICQLSQSLFFRNFQPQYSGAAFHRILGHGICPFDFQLIIDHQGLCIIYLDILCSTIFLG